MPIRLSADQRRVHRLSGPVAQQDAAGEGNPHRARQSFRPQDPNGRGFLAQHPKVRFHFPPTYCSGLNQVELWFSKIQRDVIRRDVFTSVADLARKLGKYIEAYAKLANPFRWTYTDPQKRIRIN
jgi:transposase